MKVFVAVLVWVAAVAGAVGVSSVVADSIHTTPGSGGGSGSGTDPTTIKATDTDSLFHTANFTKALSIAKAQLGPGVHLDSAALYPGYMSLVAIEGSTEVDFYVDANGNFHQTSSSTTPNTDKKFLLTKLKPALPAAITQRIASHGGVLAADLNYMVISGDFTNRKQLDWDVYPYQGGPVTYFEVHGFGGPLLADRTKGANGLQPVAG
jgi:hypothetical protein